MGKNIPGLQQSRTLTEDDSVIVYEGTIGGAEENGVRKEASLGQIKEAVGVLAGWIDYNDTTGDISLTSETWTSIPNNGLGAFSNSQYKPSGVTELMDTSTGKIDPTELALGDFIFIRNDFTVNPTINNSSLEFRYTLGAGAGAYTLEQSLGRLDRGSGINYRFSLRIDSIYMGDTNTRDNHIGLEVKCSSNATLNNAGSVIEVIKQ